jgi:hypothetical protein
MRLTFQSSPFEWFFALLMAGSPIVGSVWVEPEITKWTVFGVGCAMVAGVILAALRPVRSPS